MVPGLGVCAVFFARVSRIFSSIWLRESVSVVEDSEIASVLLRKGTASILLEWMLGELGGLARGWLNRALSTGLWGISSNPSLSSSGTSGLHVPYLAPGVGERP